MDHGTVRLVLTLFFQNEGEAELAPLRRSPIRACLYALAIINSTLLEQTRSPHPTFPVATTIIFRESRNIIVQAALQNFSRANILQAISVEENRPPHRMLFTDKEATEVQLRQLFNEPTMKQKKK